jgi:xylulokinase
MEGVVFAMRQGLELMHSLGVSNEHLIATGASIRHPLWLQLQANIYNCPIYPASTPQATGVGAALLAGIGSGVFKDYQTAIHILAPTLNQSILPEPARVDSYEKAYRTYCEIYPNIRIFNPLTRPES